MKKSLLVLHLLLAISYRSFSQNVGIGTTTPDVSAALDISATNKGLLIPRMNTAAVTALLNPANGLLVYDTQSNQLKVNVGTAAAANFQPVASGSTGWNLNGNNGINPANQFIGTTDNQPLRFKINNLQAGELHPVTGNIFWGLHAGQSNTTGFSNIAIGTDALKVNVSRNNLVAIGDSALLNNSGGLANTAIGSKSLFSNTTGTNNTATGHRSLFANTTGSSNTAIGEEALLSNTTGNNNTAVGLATLPFNTTGSSNTALGFESLFSNTQGLKNTAVGALSLSLNTTGSRNIAVGVESLFTNSTGDDNIAVGFESLLRNTQGNNNVAVGSPALLSNTTGSDNVAVGNGSLNANTLGTGNTASGSLSLILNTTGSNNSAFGKNSLSASTTGLSNTALGAESLRQVFAGNGNTAVGAFAGSALRTGNFNTLIGGGADVFGANPENSTAIGNNATCTASFQVRLGNASTTSIGGIVGFSNLSDGRYKNNVQEGVKGIDFIMKLRPVTYQLNLSRLTEKLYAGRNINSFSTKKLNENENTIFSGFVAQEVEEAARDIGYDFSGVDKPKNEDDMYGLRYAEFVVPLVKGMQEQQQMIQVLKLQNEAAQQLINDLQKRLDKLEKETGR